MTRPSTLLGPAPMEGHGVYNRSSTVQAAGLSPAMPLFERAARTVPLSPAGSARSKSDGTYTRDPDNSVVFFTAMVSGPTVAVAPGF
jgi:hypothetical protein